MGCQYMALLLALVFATTASLAHGGNFLANGNEVDNVKVVGKVCCTLTGNPLLGVCPVIDKVDVSVVCTVDGIAKILGLVQTDSTGSYAIDLDIVAGVLVDVAASCVVKVKLPLQLSICTLLPLGGLLQGSPVFYLLNGALATFNVPTLALLT